MRRDGGARDGGARDGGASERWCVEGGASARSARQRWLARRNARAGAGGLGDIQACRPLNGQLAASGCPPSGVVRTMADSLPAGRVAWRTRRSHGGATLFRPFGGRFAGRLRVSPAGRHFTAGSVVSSVRRSASGGQRSGVSSAGRSTRAWFARCRLRGGQVMGGLPGVSSADGSNWRLACTRVVCTAGSAGPRVVHSAATSFVPNLAVGPSAEVTIRWPTRQGLTRVVRSMVESLVIGLVLAVGFARESLGRWLTCR